MKTRFVCFLIMALVLLSSCRPHGPLREELWEVTGVYYYEAAASLKITFKDDISNHLYYFVDEIKSAYLDFSSLVQVTGRVLSQISTTGNQLWFDSVISPLDPITDAGIAATFDTSTWFYEAESTMFTIDIVAKCRIITDSMAVTFLP